MTISARRSERLHRAMFWAWVVLTPVSYWLRDSTAWVVIISHVAILYAAWIAMEGARVERKVDETGPKSKPNQTGGPP